MALPSIYFEQIFKKIKGIGFELFGPEGEKPLDEHVSGNGLLNCN